MAFYLLCYIQIMYVQFIAEKVKRNYLTTEITVGDFPDPSARK